MKLEEFKNLTDKEKIELLTLRLAEITDINFKLFIENRTLIGGISDQRRCIRQLRKKLEDLDEGQNDQ